ncbi:hypothetical protein GCM10007972_12440 [Iodidimonas muriae]|uniref:DUF2336 domain-containing protein n=1 Tax=Iodidimonas muriae TaxID=261467 RepID=A0ABQ2LC49_9PROT|nr:DUF2336 domain-containing protein [Iodidimonas muriae]GER06756.1 hypothetical protein JCM17843_10660 [Kordiimonadales bacterium JCM 17843]GGO10114.1 hypothetical protein GCM10007972_12440 [Iodidimonas muriae]
MTGNNDTGPNAPAQRTPQQPAQKAQKDQRYLEARRLLEAGAVADRRALAENTKTRPEVLYYLAEDADRQVRKKVATNDNTPHQADMILTTDPDEEVRVELARKIARLVPGLPDLEQEKLRTRICTVIERLAQDSLPKVRAILAEEIKNSTAVPKSVVLQLARDVEETVACPILEYSPLLNDDDLKEIIAAGLTENALVSVARRETVSEDLADDVAATLEIPAVAALLANPNAQIREETLDSIIDQAREVKSLHRPLAMRPSLSIRAMKRIAGFVASALVHHMINANALENSAAENILERVRARIMSERVDDTEAQRLLEQARDYHARGMLDDAFIVNGIENNQRELLIQCLGVMADIDAKVVRQILHSKSGRAVTALAWKAGLSMRTAFQIQTELALVSPSQLVAAKNGETYPLDDSEMVWQLSYFTE